MSLANRFKNLYRGQLFNFCFLLFPENFTPRDAHCCWQWASKKCYFEVRMDCKEALLYFHVPVHELQASEEIFMDIYMCCFIATLGAVGNFLLHASMEQICVFVAKSTLSRIRTFLVFIGLRFYSDIWAKKWRVKPLLCYSVGNEHFVTSWWPAVTPL